MNNNIFTFHSVDYDLFTCLRTKNKEGLDFKVWETEDGYYECELANKLEYSLWNTSRTYEETISQIGIDLVDIWKCFVECDLEELSEEALSFRKFILNNFEMDRCDG